MEFSSRYVAHVPDAQGYVNYSAEENKVWSILFERQIKLIPNRACESFITGLETLGITSQSIPQLPDLSQKLKTKTGWQVAPVAALISAREFFELLANKHFPVATFIRTEEELNYVKEPDIFHEIFGHCPMLTDSVYADFVHDYACKVLSFPEADWPLLQRMFWYTVEFGLIRSPEGLRAYGGGILSSISETVYSVESDVPLRVYFDPIVAFRTPYRIDRLQPIYFVIDDYQVLYDFVLSDIGKLLARTRELGEFPPLFEVDPGNPNIHIRAC
ncbi:phenylalanine 4-monooxygenase [Legionella saoudiensis]|uniref:phenylalanine 4-monooxygenase n=1 Tax=Legionella saoudiensis TaxID=1750561 RepID=UPI00073015E8|nr:phenylalanine 4-monooxygenase [Legionella saoudiensis]